MKPSKPDPVKLFIGILYSDTALSTEAIDIIGIATERSDSEPLSEDLLHLDTRSWCANDQDEARRIEVATGIFTQTHVSVVHVEEYPPSAPTSRVPTVPVISQDRDRL